MKISSKAWIPPILLFNLIALHSCDRGSSPEGRLEIKLENLHREMIDSLKKQNAVMLDSLSKIREELRTIQQSKNK